MQVLQDFVARQYLTQLPLSETQKKLADAIVDLLDSEGRVSIANLKKELFPYDELDAVNLRLRRLREEIAKLVKDAQVPFALKVTTAKKIGPEARFLWFEGVNNWSPAVSTPELDAIPESGEYESKAIESSIAPTALLLTFNDHEARKLWAEFGATRQEVSRGGVTYYELGGVGGFRVIHLHSRQGPQEAQRSATQAISHWDPELLLAVGIAFGVDEKKQHIGNVLVSTDVLDYEPARVEPDGTFTRRGKPRETSRELSDRVKNLDLQRRRQPGWPTIRMGTIVSGAKLVDNEEYRDTLTALQEDVIGGEMEGAGILAACAGNDVDMTVVKAICDWGTEKNNPSKEEDQKKAARNAAIVARAILEQGHLTRRSAEERRRLRELENPKSRAPRFPDVLGMGKHDPVLGEEQLIRDSRASSVNLDPNAAPGIPAQGTPVVDAMLDWVANPAEPQLFALLGEYGMGKTVSCQRFTRELAERRKANPTLPMPLYFNLKNVADARLADNLEDLVVTCMRDDWLPKHSPQHTWQAFTSWLATGPCVVIFDGLEEMLVKLDSTQGSLFLNRLLGTLQLLDDEDANRRIRLVLSCRTQYFRTLLEQRSFFLGKDRQDLRADSYRAMTLLPLGDDQIRRYLEIALPGSDIVRIMELVASVHNLPELAARPYTLRLIAEHIPEIERARTNGKPVFGVTLYATMVERWLERDEGKHFIDPEHKSAFMAELAAWLWREKKTAAPARDVETIFRRWIRGDEDLSDIYPSTLTKSDKDKLNEDLRTATFLARQDDERGSTFGFAHTSLQEYFLAHYLLDAIQRKDRSRWAMRTPSAETLDFLGQLLAEAQEPELIDTLSSWKTPYQEQASELLLRYTFAARKRKYPTPNLARIDLSGAHLDDWDFLGTSDDPLNLAEANFTNTSLRRTSFSHVNLTGAHFIKSTLNQATFHNCTTQNINWHDASHPGATWQSYIPSKFASRINAIRTGHIDQTTGIAWHPTGDLIATISSDNTCIIWNPRTGNSLTELIGHADELTKAAWHPTGSSLATTSRDGTCIIWNPTTGQKIITLAGHIRGTTAAAWRPDGKLIATTSWDGTCIIWNHITEQKIITLTGHGGAITGLAWHPDGTQLATTSWDNTCIIWNPTNGQKLTTLTGHTNALSGVSWHPNGKLLATVSWDETCIIWNPINGQKLTTLTGHTNALSGVSWHPNGKLISTTSWDGYCTIWNPDTYEKSIIHIGHLHNISKAAWNPDGKVLATTGQDRTSIIWNSHSREPITILTSHTDSITGISWSSDGNFLATAGQDHTTIIWNLTTGRRAATFTGHTHAVTAVEWHPDGTRLATTGRDGSCIIWDPRTNKIFTIHTGHADSLTGLAWHPKGICISTTSLDHTCIIWNPSTGQKIITLIGHAGAVSGAAWHPNGSCLATASEDQTCIIWNPDTAERILTLTGHTDAVTGVAWSPDGTRIATASNDGTCIIWQPDTRERLLTLTGHTAAVTGVAWSPDGTRIATASNDRTCIIWNHNTGEKITTLTDHARAVTGIAWHPTGDLIATADASGLIRISHPDGTLERAFISVRPRVPGVESYASWTPEGLDVLEGEAWRVLRVPEPGGGSRRLEIPGLSYEPPTD